MREENEVTFKNDCVGREWEKQAFKELSLSIREYDDSHRS